MILETLSKEEISDIYAVQTVRDICKQFNEKIFCSSTIFILKYPRMGIPNSSLERPVSREYPSLLLCKPIIKRWDCLRDAKL